MRVALVTGTRSLTPLGSFPVEFGAFEEDRVLLAELTRRRIESGMIFWDGPEVDHAQIEACVVRSVVNHVDRPDEYLAWADKVSTVTQLWNPAAVARATIGKGYLRELASLGIPIVPTVWLDAGDPSTIATRAAAQGWDTIILKPDVGSTGSGVKRFDAANLAAADDYVRARRGAMVMQKFLSSVERQGELSLIFIDGVFRYAVMKYPAEGDYSIHGWSREGKRLVYRNHIVRVDAEPKVIARASAALEALHSPTLCVRFDFLRDDDGEYVLSEMEALSPSLYLAQIPEAAALLADAIMAKLA